MSNVQNVFLVGAKSLGAYGGYETFVYKLTEYHQNNPNIKYHVACKANGDGYMDETKLDNVKRISDTEFEFHNARCFKIHIPQIGAAQAIYYDVAALRECCKYIKKNNIEKPIVYIMACRIGPFAILVVALFYYLFDRYSKTTSRKYIVPGIIAILICFLFIAIIYDHRLNTIAMQYNINFNHRLDTWQYWANKTKFSIGFWGLGIGYVDKETFLLHGKNGLSFLLVPLYTSYLNTQEYGIIDLVATTINIIIPIFSLNIAEGIMRFTLEEKNSNKINCFSKIYKDVN